MCFTQQEGDSTCPQTISNLPSADLPTHTVAHLPILTTVSTPLRALQSSNIAGKTQVTASMKAPTRTESMRDNNQFFVEAIIGERAGADERPEYLVKWAGYSHTESPWEPRRNLRAYMVADWDVEKARLGEIEDDVDADDAVMKDAKVDDDDIVEADGADNESLQDAGEPSKPTLPAGSPSVATMAEVDKKASTGRLSDEQVDDVPNIDDVAKDNPDTQEDLVMQDTELVSDLPNAVIEERENDEEAEFKDNLPFDSNEPCNDPASQQLEVHEHGTLSRLCENCARTSTCTKCFEAALGTLNDSQRYAYNHGADFALCQSCLDRPDGPTSGSAAPCICLAKRQCCFCLWDNVNALVKAKEEADDRMNDGQCFDCASRLDGTEWIFRCASCRGTHIHLDI